MVVPADVLRNKEPESHIYSVYLFLQLTSFHRLSSAEVELLCICHRGFFSLLSPNKKVQFILSLLSASPGNLP